MSSNLRTHTTELTQQSQQQPTTTNKSTNMNTTIKILGATAKVAVILAATAKIYVCARLAHAIAKADNDTIADNNN